MNLKTTLLLILLLGVGAGVWWWLERSRPEVAVSETAGFLEKSLRPDKLTRIEASRDGKTLFAFERSGKEWSLPGKWPTRTLETDAFVDTLTSLQPRFAPIALAKDASLKPYGLDAKPLTVRVSLGDVTHTLRFGEEPGDANRFTRPTYVRLDDKPEVIRLGPGVLASLDRTLDYFQQRRLFPVERTAKEDEKEKTELLVASQVEIQAPSRKMLFIKDDDWRIKDVFDKKDKTWDKAFSDERIDPARLKSFLVALGDVWAEKFVDKKSKSLDDFGLREPEFTFTVTRTSGVKVKLLIGKVVAKDEADKREEEHRYAKLENNDQIFEIKTDKLKDITAATSAFRDSLLARFKADDVKRLEIRQPKEETLVFMRVTDKDHEKDRSKDKWRMMKPKTQDAEKKEVEEVLEKLAGLRAGEKEMIDKADLKAHGLDTPAATVLIHLEEGKDEKRKKPRDIVLHLGVKEKEKGKLFARVEGWPRVNQLNDDVLKLATRPAIAYRPKRVLDFAAADVTKVDVQRAGDKFAVEKTGDTWKLTSPVKAEIQAEPLVKLVGELAKLEGAELIAENPKADDLDKVYGLAKPALSIALHVKDKKQTLAIGSARDKTQEYYARIDQGPVFTIKKPLRDDIDRSSLSYRPLQVWKVDKDAITEMTFEQGDNRYTLVRMADKWKLTIPFNTDASDEAAKSLTGQYSVMNAERYEAHQDKDPKQYGFDSPTMKLSVTTKEKQVLTLGKAVAKGWYGRIEGVEGVFVVSESELTGIPREAFAFLEKTLLNADVKNIERIRYPTFTLEAKKDGWEIVDGKAPPFKPAEQPLEQALDAWHPLRTEKYVALGDKIDWTKFGFTKESPAVTLTLKDKKEHVIELGGEKDGGRYARLDKRDAVVLLDARLVDILQRSPLDFADTLALKVSGDVTAITRQKPGDDIELALKDDNWQIVKPMTRDADNLTIGDILKRIVRLEAKRVAALAPKDLTPFGLEKPTATVTFQTEATKHVIKVGDLTNDKKRNETDERYAMIGDSKTVVVLPAELSRLLVGKVLYYADRNVASFSGVDTAILERGLRKATFVKGDGWQMTAPMKADAEDAALDDLIRSLQRLRADEIVADKGADPKKYGFDEPLLQWQFKASDADKMHLIVGGPENDKPDARRYARLGKDGPVFLLSGKLIAKLSDEYRGRKVWPPFDAAQSDGLQIATPERTFTILKQKDGWIIANEKEKAVDDKAVVETLATLANLKAVQYVTDVKKDNLIYGLTKPEWRIGVTTPNGPRELWLGSFEGKSKRRYATVRDSGVVFLLSEADTAMLTRMMNGYLVEAKKK